MTAILVRSGRTDALEKVGALDAGADDYVTQPFSRDELMARLRAVLELLARNPGRLVTQTTAPSHPRHLFTEPGMGYRFQP